MSDKKTQILSPQDFADAIGKSLRTVQRWDSQKQFAARRTALNEPYYTQDDVNRYFEPENAPLRA